MSRIDEIKARMENATILISELHTERLDYSEYVMLADSANDVDDLIAELERYQKWVNDLQSGMYVNCVYCGHRYGPSDKIPASMAEVLKQHIEQCPKHPMSELKKELERTKQALAREGFNDIENMISRYKQVMIDENEISITKDEEIKNLQEHLKAMTAMAQRNAKEEYLCSTTGDLDEKQEKKV